MEKRENKREREREKKRKKERKKEREREKIIKMINFKVYKFWIFYLEFG